MEVSWIHGRALYRLLQANMEQAGQRVYPSVRQDSHLILKNAGVVELVDTMDSKSIGRKPVPVQVRLSVPFNETIFTALAAGQVCKDFKSN